MKTATALLAILFATAACTPGWTGAPDPSPSPVSVPTTGSYRVIESASGATVSLSTVIARAAMSDVVFFGEQHDDPETHFLEFALLEGIGRETNRVVLSLEMFERDVQPQLDAYLRGALSESLFVAGSRPWPRYATDYRPMVQLARARGWKVVAANIPRPMASAISRKGMSALDTVTAAERRFAAASMSCPNDAYFARFAEAMGGHGAGGGPPTATDASAAAAMTQRFYEAQCAKDETMAESIAANVTPGAGMVMHVNGAFHSDYRQGTAMRVARRAPDARILVITAVPVDNPGTAAIGEERAKADYVIFTRKP